MAQQRELRRHSCRRSGELDAAETDSETAYRSQTLHDHDMAEVVQRPASSQVHFRMLRFKALVFCRSFQKGLRGRRRILDQRDKVLEITL